jgi:AAA domain, putative AbiEii toxin, Type IV TA system
MDLVRFALARYRAFDRKVSVELAPITVVIGGNHAGKTTLCRAPWFVSQPFASGSSSPFPFGDPSGAPAPSLLRVARGISGFEAELGLLRAGESWTVGLHASARVEAGNQPMLARLTIARGENVLFDEQDLEWSAARQAIRDHDLEGVHEEIGSLGGLRAEAEPSYPLQGFMPAGVGFRGQDAPMALANARDLSVLDDWSKRHLDVTYGVERERSWDSFRVVVNDGHTPVLLAESGTGLVQVLPVAAALLLLPRLPALFCIEHPELHLHPHAHRAVAELLIQGHARHPATRFLVETHSDTFVLRLRRAVVEKRLDPENVRLIYVARGPEGSTAKAIRLNERGVPDWWPKGVFAEAQAEYSEMRRRLNEADRYEDLLR